MQIPSCEEQRTPEHQQLYSATCVLHTLSLGTTRGWIITEIMPYFGLNLLFQIQNENNQQWMCSNFSCHWHCLCAAFTDYKICTKKVQRSGILNQSVTDRIIMLMSKWPIYNCLIDFCKFKAIVPLQLMLKMAHLFPDQCPAVCMPPCGDTAQQRTVRTLLPPTMLPLPHIWGKSVWFRRS